MPRPAGRPPARDDFASNSWMDEWVVGVSRLEGEPSKAEAYGRKMERRFPGWWLYIIYRRVLALLSSNRTENLIEEYGYSGFS